MLFSNARGETDVVVHCSQEGLSRPFSAIESRRNGALVEEWTNEGFVGGIYSIPEA